MWTAERGDWPQAWRDTADRSDYHLLATAARRTTRAFLACHALRWLPIGFVIPILVLVPTQRGLALPTVADTGLLLALAFGTTAWHFLAGAVLGGLGRALLTGPLESWYVDTVRAVDPGIALRPGLSAAGFAEGIALPPGRCSRRCRRHVRRRLHPRRAARRRRGRDAARAGAS